MKGLFIVLEGIDGSGTSTQAELLQDYFVTQKSKAIISPEPTASPIGKLIREAMQNPIICIQDSQKFEEQMAYLFAADRHYHLYNDIDGVFKLIKEQTHVITTRYLFSSLAYNCHTLEQLEFVSSLNSKFPNPDLVVYLDIPVEISMERLRDRTFLEIYENEKKLTQVRQNYQDIFNGYQDLCLQIDGTDSKQSIHQEIIQFLKNHFPQHS